MSREAREWAWDAPTRDPRKLLILLSIADVADEYGCGAYPSKGRMAKDSRSDERTVQRHLGDLVKEGLIEVECKATQHRPTTYCIPDLRQDNLSPLNVPRGDTGETKPNSSPSELGTGIKGDDARALEDDPLLGFDHFWEAYPKRHGRRLGRGLCEKRWVKYSLEDRRAAYRGAKNYALDVAAGKQIAKDPDRWLRDRLWTDWQGPADPDEPSTTSTQEVAWDPERGFGGHG